MQRDVYNITTQGFSETHQHHLNGIQQGDASELISKLQSLGAGFQEQIQKAELDFTKFIKENKLTSLMAWKYWRAEYFKGHLRWVQQEKEKRADVVVLLCWEVASCY